MKTFFTIAFILAASLLLAQFENPFGTIHHSSRDAYGNLHLRWQDLNAGAGTTLCYYNSANGAWNPVEPASIEPGTMEALVPYSFGQKVRYRLHYSMDYEQESIAMLHAAYWDADSFPPALNNMALMGTDPEGDSLMVYNPNLDLREAYIATTPAKLYCSLKNLSGQYPTMNSISSYNLYLAMITNLEAASDSVAYAMVYSFNIPGLISNGLYKVGYDAATEMPVFSRLGNIQAQTSAGTLHLACNFSDLAADPEFGAWPNASQSLMLVGTTMAVDIDLPTMTPNIGLADYGVPSVVVFQDNFYQVNSNTLPSVVPQSWNPETNQFTLVYHDPDGDFPLVASVDPLISPVVRAYPLDPLNPANTQYLAQLEPNQTYGVLNYTFTDNGINMVTGEYTPGDADDNSLIPASLACSLPNPFSLGTGSKPIKIMGLANEPLELQLFNLKGQKMGSLFSGKVTQPELVLNWDGRINGKPLSSGMYFLRLDNGKRSLNHRFVILK